MRIFSNKGPTRKVNLKLYKKFLIDPCIRSLKQKMGPTFSMINLKKANWVLNNFIKLALSNLKVILELEELES